MRRGGDEDLRELRSLATFEQPAWLCKVKAGVRPIDRVQEAGCDKGPALDMIVRQSSHRM